MEGFNMSIYLRFSNVTAASASLMWLLAGYSPSNAEVVKPTFVGSGQLAVCVDPTFPPMEFFEKVGDKDPVGVDIDLINGLAKYWGVQPRLMTMDFSGLLPSLEAKRCDAVISGAAITPARLKTLAAIPYLNTSVVIIAKAGKSVVVNDPKDLAGKVVAVQAGTQYVDRVNKVNEELKNAGQPLIQMQTYPKQTDAVQQLLVERAVAAYTQDTEQAFRNLQSAGQFSVVYTYPDAQQMGIFVRPSAEDVQAIHDAVAALVKDGSLSSIAEKWKLSPHQLEGIGK
jgi:polar amino acid transport system substrate-binding protein